MKPALAAIALLAGLVLLPPAAQAQMAGVREKSSTRRERASLAPTSTSSF